MKLDLHVHTTFSSDGRMGVKMVVRQAKKLGLGGVAITDHNSVEAQTKYGLHRDSGLLLIPGCEVSSAGGHILAYGVKVLIPRDLPVVDTVEEITAEGGIAVAAHPYRSVTGLGEDNILQGRFRFVEGFNGRTRPNGNEKAMNLARRIGATVTGGSDAHFQEELGSAFTIVPDNVTTVDDILEAIRAGRTRAAGQEADFTKYAGTAGANVVRFLRRGMRRM